MVKYSPTTTMLCSANIVVKEGPSAVISHLYLPVEFKVTDFSVT
jgi:hypothetical protein